ncbi:hypothetical protein [Marivirga harenae]|uniref:hypothetical protein n=1 Tax=Marivirga harenae TaxID=2010992 RepID=UPI0026DFE934|nr:hypothetical protein [Marivirga harenae]WKV12195.1 hypothetical protein Q3Y49_18520 [Marivirga harenae]
MELINEALHNRLLELSNEEQRPKTRLDIYLIIVSAILYNCRQNNEVSHDFPSSYWVKLISKRYNIYLNKLVESEVIIRDGNYHGKKSYAISSEYLLSPSPVIPVFYNNPEKSFSSHLKKNSSISERLLQRLNRGMHATSIDLDSFKEDYNSASAMDVYSYQIYLSGLPDNLYVDSKIQYPNGTVKHGYRVSEVQKRLHENNLSAYRSGSSILLTTPADFAQTKYINLVKSTVEVSRHLAYKDFRITRNSNTRRVYSIITSLPSKALPYLKLNGESVLGIDLRSSQLTLLANILYSYRTNDEALLSKFTGKQKTFLDDLYQLYLKNIPASDDDIETFFNDVIQQDIYQILADELKINRSQAKQFTFSIFFSKSDSKSILKARVKEKYPTVFKIIDGYKDMKEAKKRYVGDKAYGKFASNLQAIEAYIFIDHIFNRLHKNKIVALLRHDSVLVSERNKDSALNIMQGVMQEFGFISDFKIENYNQEKSLNTLDHEITEGFEHLYKPTEELETDDLLQILEIGWERNLVSEKAYNHIQSRLIELQKNDLPLPDEDEQQIVTIFNTLFNQETDQAV